MSPTDPHRAVVLFSGGLDSMLAVRILQRQGLEVEALNIRTTFDCCKTSAAAEAHALGARLTVVSVEDDYVDLIRHPKHGHGKGLNPCVDCRTYMARMARRMMESVGACVVATGEIVGQRPMSQKRRDLAIIERESGLVGRLLRPLSAKLLSPTIPEQEGVIDRDQLYDIQGRCRGPLIELAGQFDLPKIPQPSTGCPLTEVTFAPRVADLMSHSAEASRWEFEILNTGRHFRLNRQTKVVVGRNEAENASLASLVRRADAPPLAYLHPENFLGPDGIVLGLADAAAIDLAGALLLRYTRRFDPGNALFSVTHAASTRTVRILPRDDVADLTSL